jgi:hypothetical protein
MAHRTFKASTVSCNLSPGERNRGAVPRTGEDGRKLLAEGARAGNEQLTKGYI